MGDQLDEISAAHAAWTDWVDRLEDPEEQMAVGELLRKHDCTTLEGMCSLQQDLLIGIFARKYPPVLISTAMPLLRELQNSLYLLLKYQGAPESAMTAVLQQTTKAIMFEPPKAITAKYTTSIAQDPNIRDAIEVGEAKKAK